MNWKISIARDINQFCNFLDLNFQCIVPTHPDSFASGKRFSRVTGRVKTAAKAVLSICHQYPRFETGNAALKLKIKFPMNTSQVFVCGVGRSKGTRTFAFAAKRGFPGLAKSGFLCVVAAGVGLIACILALWESPAL